MQKLKELFAKVVAFLKSLFVKEEEAPAVEDTSALAAVAEVPAAVPEAPVEVPAVAEVPAEESTAQ